MKEGQSAVAEPGCSQKIMLMSGHCKLVFLCFPTTAVMGRAAPILKYHALPQPGYSSGGGTHPWISHHGCLRHETCTTAASPSPLALTFQSSTSVFCISVAADTLHAMGGKTKDIAYNSGNCHTQLTFSPQCFSQTDTSWAHHSLSAEGLQEWVNKRAVKAHLLLARKEKKRNCFCCFTSLGRYCAIHRHS